MEFAFLRPRGSQPGPASDGTSSEGMPFALRDSRTGELLACFRTARAAQAAARALLTLSPGAQPSCLEVVPIDGPAPAGPAHEVPPAARPGAA